MPAHCWVGYDDYLYSTDRQKYYDRYLDRFEGLIGSATCLLPDGHAGRHRWTPDDDIEVGLRELPEVK